MRKGADCLSKWVGEAERQLRLLFEEARACQPSIIFFDEIDGESNHVRELPVDAPPSLTSFSPSPSSILGLAPVRSSKQDQIHASIVSTLLALMDGMDGRGSSFFFFFRPRLVLPPTRLTRDSLLSCLLL